MFLNLCSKLCYFEFYEYLVNFLNSLTNLPKEVVGSLPDNSLPFETTKVIGIFFFPMMKLQNSIRHNLSLQFCFRKIDRNVYNKGDGKGGYWELGIDANKSERKRIRNRSRVRTSISSPKSSESPTIAEKRRKCCNDRPHITSINSKHLTNQDVNLIIDDFAGSQNNNYLFNRTLNSINASISVDHTLHVDDIGIGSIIEVDQQIAQVVAAQNTHDIANQEQNHHQINLSQTSNEFHVLGDITNGDYLNINTLDLMSSADDMFDSDSFAPASASDGLSTVSAKDSGVPELITTMVTSMAMDSQCGNEVSKMCPYICLVYRYITRYLTTYKSTSCSVLFRYI